MNLIEIGHVVGARRAELGLTQAQLAHLSGLSRQTVVGLEKGTLSDLGVNRVGQVMAVLGLESAKPDTQARRKKRGLWMAAKTASVSYAYELAPEVLEQALASGDVPPTFAPHLTHLLDEAPVPTVVMAVEEAAAGLAQRRKTRRDAIRPSPGAVGMKEDVSPWRPCHRA